MTFVTVQVSSCVRPAVLGTHWRIARGSQGLMPLLQRCPTPRRRAPRKTPTGNAGSPGAGEGAQAPQPPKSGQHQAVAMPYGLPTAGAVFFLAGFLKLLIMCFPYSPMAIAMYMRGQADLGFLAVIKMAPLALGLVALSKWIVDRKLQERRPVRWAIIVCSIGALFLSRFIFARPKPNHVLAPMVQAAHEAKVARMQQVQDAMRMQEEQRQRVLKSPKDAKEFLKQREQRLGRQ